MTNAFISRARRAALRLERLESREVPASLITPGLPNGTAADGDSAKVLDISDDGSIVLFTSKANNLVTGVSDSNNLTDLYWRNLTTATTLLVSARPGKVAIGFDDTEPGRAVLSGDGSKVAFVSATPAGQLTGLVQADSSASDDVFLWSSVTQAVSLVSATDSTNGNSVAIGKTSFALSPNISTTGQFVAYLSPLENNTISNRDAFDDTDTPDIYLRDVTANNANGAATVPVTLDAANSTFMVGNNGDVFVQAGGRYMSDDATRFVFSTPVEANFLVAGAIDQPSTNGTFDVFVRDLSLPSVENSIQLVSFVAGSTLTAIGNVVGQESDGAIISADGDTVIFLSNAPGGASVSQLVTNYKANGTGVSLYRTTNLFLGSPTTTLVNAQNGTTNAAGVNSDIGIGDYFVSTDGRVVLFNSKGTNLVAGLDTNGTVQDAFVRDFTGTTPITELVSVGDVGNPAADSTGTGISGDGTLVIFETISANLLIGVADDNGVNDVFVRDRTAGVTRIVSANPGGRVAGNGASSSSLLSEDGSLILFATKANNLTVPSLTGTTSNLYFAQPAFLPSPLALSGVVVASGTADGRAQAYTFDTSLNLTPNGNLFQPFAFTGDVRSSAADFDGDGSTDIVYGIGPGGGSLINVVASLGADVEAMVYEAGFVGGVFVVAGDMDGDGIAEIVVTPDQGGGGRVTVFRLQGSSLVRIADFFGIQDSTFRGGARAALGDVDGDGILDLIVTAGFGGGPRVAIFDGASVLTGVDNPLKLIEDFFTFSPSDQFTLRNGAFVTAGDLDQDGRADLIFGGGPGGGPRVFALSGAGVLSNVELEKANPLANFFAGNPNLRGGVRITAKNIDNDGFADLVAGSGESEPAQIRTYLGKNFPIGGQGEPTLLQSFAPFSGSPSAGVYVG